MAKDRKFELMILKWGGYLGWTMPIEDERGRFKKDRREGNVRINTEIGYRLK